MKIGNKPGLRLQKKKKKMNTPFSCVVRRGTFFYVDFMVNHVEQAFRGKI